MAVGNGVLLLLAYNCFASFAGILAFAANLAVVTTHGSNRVTKQSAIGVILRSDGCLSTTTIPKQLSEQFFYRPS